MKKVLIVDDEVNLLASLKDGFSEQAGAFTIETAENGAKASVILSSMPIDLVVTDLKMPVMDGFELLAYMSKHHPQVPTIIMTAHGSRPEIENKLKLLSVQYLQKPFDLEELAAAIMVELNIPSSSKPHGLTLPAFLQLIAEEQRSCSLTIGFNEEKGSLYFRNGELLDAETGSLKGDDAVFHMASWDHAKIDMSPRCAKTEKKVRGSINELLMEGRRRMEERELMQAAAPAAALAGSSAPAAARTTEPGPIDADALLKDIQRDVQQQRTSASGTSPKEESMATTREILSELSKLESIEAVCLVARDGFLLDSIARKGIDREMIGAIASSGFGASTSMGKQLDKGSMLISMIEFEKGPVMLAPIGEDAFLVIVADKEANLGMIRLKLKKHSHELALAAAI